MSFGGEWGAHVGTGGFRGEYGATGSYNTDYRVRYRLGLGVTPAWGREIYQVNAGLEWQTFNRLGNDDFAWHPIRLGLIGVYSPDTHLFLRSPSKYPDDTYYTPTSIHALVSFTTGIRIGNVSLEYFVSIPSPYIIARYNNDHWKSYFCCSSGLETVFYF
jgi:hypothetical protein